MFVLVCVCTRTRDEMDTSDDADKKDGPLKHMLEIMDQDMRDSNITSTMNKTPFVHHFRPFKDMLAYIQMKEGTIYDENEILAMRKLYDTLLDQAQPTKDEKWRRKRRVDNMELEVEHTKKKHKARLNEVKAELKEELSEQESFMEDCRLIAQGFAHRSHYRGKMRADLDSIKTTLGAAAVTFTPQQQDWMLINVYKVLSRAAKDPILRDSLSFSRSGTHYKFNYTRKETPHVYFVHKTLDPLVLSEARTLLPGPVEQKGRCFSNAYIPMGKFRESLSLYPAGGGLPREWLIRLCILISHNCKMHIPKLRFKREQLLTVLLFDLHEFLCDVKIGNTKGLLGIISDYNDDWSLV